MNTTPTTFNRPRVPYTVVGGTKIDRLRKYSYRLTVLILNRGGRFYRSEFFQEIQNLSLGEVICIEGPQHPYDIEPLSRQYPDIRFLLLQGETTAGEKINLGFEEARSKLILVLWSDMDIESISLQDVDSSELCTVPQLTNSKGDYLPTVQIPAIIKGKLKLLPFQPGQAGIKLQAAQPPSIKTIIPFDYCGIYAKKAFQSIGGYEGTLRNPYWQKLDFGFRAFLWGESIRYSPALRLRYLSDLHAEDTTTDESYKLFYLRNLAIRRISDRCVLPWIRLPQYMLKSDTGPFYAYREFREARRWVQKYSRRFKEDVQTLVREWEIPE